MFQIVNRRELVRDVVLLEVSAARAARAAQAGQFVVLCTEEHGERIPLTIADCDLQRGTISIVVQAVGASTRRLCSMQEGDEIYSFAAPLGKPSEWLEWDVERLRAANILFVAGGVGAAPVYPQVKWLHEHDVPCDVIIGAKTKSMLIFEEEMRSVCANLYVATDDGTAGYHGLVTDLFRNLMDEQGKNYGMMVAIGPMVMMKYAVRAAQPYGVPVVVSMNTLMVDGTGMCGACRVSVGGVMKFTCVDGPEFDGYAVDFDEAMRRSRMYHTQERAADCRCIAQMAAESKM